MNGRPAIQKDTVQYGLIGDVVRLECSAYSVPLPEKTSWSFNGQPIDSSHHDYSVSHLVNESKSVVGTVFLLLLCGEPEKGFEMSPLKSPVDTIQEKRRFFWLISLECFNCYSEMHLKGVGR